MHDFHVTKYRNASNGGAIMFNEIIENLDEQIKFFNNHLQTRESRFSVNFCLEKLIFLQNLRDALSFNSEDID